MSSIQKFFCGLLVLISPTLAQQIDTSAAGDYIVLKKGNQKLSGDVRLSNDPEKGTRVICNGKTEYPVGELQAFMTEGVYFTNLPLVHKQGDKVLPVETLVMQVVQGKVNIYSRFAALDLDRKELRYDYFSKSGDAIQEIGYANLKTALGDNPESLKHLQSSYQFKPSPLLFAGFGVTLSSLIPGKVSHAKYRKAIDVYNFE